jgi:hypothetical protein
MYGSLKGGVLLITLVLAVPRMDAEGKNILVDCLNASTATPFRLSEHLKECFKDELRLAENASIQKTEIFFKVSADEVNFIGCVVAPLATTMLPVQPLLRFDITYPGGNISALTTYVPAILHELGHVYQLKKAGSRQKLEQSLSGERIELGADFLAGLASHQLDLNPGLFERSLYLFGSYSSNQTDPHGRPEDRVSAFRRGYFYSPTELVVDSPYRDFQDNIFGQITRH